MQPYSQGRRLPGQLLGYLKHSALTSAAAVATDINSSWYSALIQRQGEPAPGTGLPLAQGQPAPGPGLPPAHGNRPGHRSPSWDVPIQPCPLLQAWQSDGGHPSQRPLVSHCFAGEALDSDCRLGSTLSGPGWGEQQKVAGPSESSGRGLSAGSSTHVSTAASAVKGDLADQLYDRCHSASGISGHPEVRSLIRHFHSNSSCRVTGLLYAKGPLLSVNGPTSHCNWNGRFSGLGLKGLFSDYGLKGLPRCLVPDAIACGKVKKQTGHVIVLANGLLQRLHGDTRARHIGTGCLPNLETGSADSSCQGYLQLLFAPSGGETPTGRHQVPGWPQCLGLGLLRNRAARSQPFCFLPGRKGEESPSSRLHALPPSGLRCGSRQSGAAARNGLRVSELCTESLSERLAIPCHRSSLVIAGPGGGAQPFSFWSKHRAPFWYNIRGAVVGSSLAIEMETPRDIDQVRHYGDMGRWLVASPLGAWSLHPVERRGFGFERPGFRSEKPGLGSARPGFRIPRASVCEGRSGIALDRGCCGARGTGQGAGREQQEERDRRRRKEGDRGSGPASRVSKETGQVEVPTGQEAGPEPSGGLKEGSHGGWTWEEVGTVANGISLARLLSGPVLAGFILAGQPGTALIGLAAAGASDWLDGYIAKHCHTSSVLGSYLDPLADKVLMGTVVLAMAAEELLPGPLVAFVVGRDVALVGGAFVYRAYQMGWQWKGAKDFFRISEGGAPKVEPLMVSKINTVFQLLLVASGLSAAAWDVPDASHVNSLCYVVAATTALSWMGYTWSATRTLNGLQRVTKGAAGRKPR